MKTPYVRRETTDARRERVLAEALEEVESAIDHVAIANWPGRDEEAKVRVRKAFDAIYRLWRPASR